MERDIEAAPLSKPRARLRVVSRSLTSAGPRRINLRARARHLRIEGRKVKD